ncbi:RluA family pseudouridine synthase [Rubinisphaera margarita]|uniref:RluA family pseudouridine synthase n=1 Tax=Rubinisphaera margarita TaxID=2909586 RepID=UPI001EE9AB97|nr:RluA family pseudouridine synthase [Rubinisphaera margarita]MCG6155414.1 RluA family pseudouridine synthase [Rubinisphaera margarita]
MDSNDDNTFAAEATEIDVDRRLDYWLSVRFPEFSRSQWQRLISAGGVTINGRPVKPSWKLRLGEQIAGGYPEPSIPAVLPPAPQISLNILYEDDHIVVLNKQAGLIVHPGKANYGGTLVNALIHHFEKLSGTGGAHRPGIVHRLDRDTTGVIVVAKDDQTHDHISAQFADRTVEKEYQAVVWGKLEFDTDFVETHIRAHSKHREKMIVCGPDPEARLAQTFYEVQERFRDFTAVKMLPKTGRTHQLRVHMQHLGHPIVADSLYRGHSIVHLADLLDSREHLTENPCLISRQALHAHRLQFDHPATGERVEFIAPIPDDMERLLAALREHRRES